MASEAMIETQDGMLHAWSKQAFLQRLLLPQDFMGNVRQSGEESLTCHRTTKDYLVMSDRVEKKTMRRGDARKYSKDLSYRPREFKNKTLKILADSKDVQCDKCRGKKTVPCPTKQNCSRCDGKGRREEEMSGTHTSSTPDRVVTSGAGRFSTTTTIPGSSSSRSYSYKVPVICDKCTGTGKVTCGKCDGKGWVTCNRCYGSGVLVKGNLITRKFTYSQEFGYQLSGLAQNEFKNGLGSKHFNSVEGDLVSSEYLSPGDRAIVLERESVHSYNVLSREYAYKDRQFYLNQITSSGDMKYVASSLPFSKLRVAAASVLSCGTVAAVVAVLAFLV